MLSEVKLDFKRVVLLASLSLVPLVVMLLLIHDSVGKSLDEIAFSHLDHIHNSKIEALTEWFDGIFSTTDTIAGALQRHYGQRPVETDLNIKQTIIQENASLFSLYLSNENLAGFMVTELDGAVIYVSEGKYSTFKPDQESIEKTKKSKTVYIKKIEDTQLQPFVSSVIYNKAGEQVMLLFGFFNRSSIDRVIQVNNQYWKTNEIHVVGSDFNLLSSSTPIPGINRIETEAVRSALESQSGHEITTDCRNVLVYSVYSPFIYNDIHWAMVSEVDFDEVSIPLRALEKQILIVFVTIGFVAMLIVILLLHIQRMYEKKLHQRAYYDSLTKLPNRLMLRKHLNYLTDQLSMKKNSKLAVMFLDIDNFKEINDSHGHAHGDSVLVHFANVLRSTLRSGDFICRNGGDEFVLVFDRYADERDLIHIADKLIDAISRPFFNKDEEHTFLVGASIGIAIYHEKESGAELLRNADAAMYVAKEEGRNCAVLYEKHMTEQAQYYIQMKQKIAYALENDRFYMLYQPKYSTASQQIVGFEALVRMYGEEGETISPVDFIPVAEKSSQIKEIDRWVTNHVIKQLAQWKIYDVPCIAINVSATTVADNAFIDTLIATLEQYQIDGEKIELELTERIMLKYDKKLEDIFIRFRKIGIRLSIDDFGTGYSSLQYLRSLPVHSLKIDASFIRDIAVDDNDKNIIEAIIAMGHTYNYELIAEGVETYEQFEILETIECDTIQGYLFSKPVSENDVIKLI